ncbi:MAG: hypothetical protein PVG65_03560 [Candidatus Thorarchaeota archaeon]|jgi:hypothetical protein
MFSHTNSKGQTYWLHTKEVKLRSGKVQRIFFFSKDSSGSIDMPEGYTVIESKRTGLPLLKKK